MRNTTECLACISEILAEVGIMQRGRYYQGVQQEFKSILNEGKKYLHGSHIVVNANNLEI